MPEDPAVAAKAREQRATYIVGGLGCIGIGALIVWSLGTLNTQASRRARQHSTMEQVLQEDWQYKGPTPTSS